MKRRTTKKDPKRFLPTNVEQRKEKEYIQRHLREGQPANLTNMIIKHYFQAPKVPFLGYGMPRPGTSAESVKNCQVRGKAPGIVVVSNHKSLSSYAHHCQHHLGTNGEYCDILGPGSCSACIEETNRYIGDEIQRRLFPRIFMSQNCLVVPKLSRTMRQGHMKQVRKKGLTELSLPQNEVTEMFRRKETPLSVETYHSARQKQRVRVMNSYSEWTPVTSGIPQGIMTPN
ncbi:uncharacterized protein LOC130010924 [Patella vulgata]|uniref:uncharacterized protein LOC130010924 n=1 Tax=Patella vulgata TaxID=6465 RepID=UPI0024A904C5|nr:uncharacterized protein LOC130010924 [Patella vulgata]